MIRSGPSLRTRLGGRRGHFTLVEMLVVVAIVALLAALLLPSLAQGARQAQAAKCLSNLRQLHSLAMDYVSDNDGVLPAFNGPAGSWIASLWPYASAKAYPSYSGNALPFVGTVFACPTAVHDTVLPRRSYGVNTTLLGGNSSVTPVRIGTVPAPSLAIFLADNTAASALACSTIFARHAGFANGVFLDGHGEAFLLTTNIVQDTRYHGVFWTGVP